MLWKNAAWLRRSPRQPRSLAFALISPDIQEEKRLTKRDKLWGKNMEKNPFVKLWLPFSITIQILSSSGRTNIPKLLRFRKDYVTQIRTIVKLHDISLSWDLIWEKIAANKNLWQALLMLNCNGLCVGRHASLVEHGQGCVWPRTPCVATRSLGRRHVDWSKTPGSAHTLPFKIT